MMIMLIIMIVLVVVVVVVIAKIIITYPWLLTPSTIKSPLL